MSILAYFISLQEHLPTWRTEGFLILLMNCIYLHYITHTSPELTRVEKSSKTIIIWRKPFSTTVIFFWYAWEWTVKLCWSGECIWYNNAHKCGFDLSDPFPPEEEDYQVVVLRSVLRFLLNRWQFWKVGVILCKVKTEVEKTPICIV